MCKETITALFNHWMQVNPKIFLVNCSYFSKSKCQNMSWAVKHKSIFFPKSDPHAKNTVLHWHYPLWAKLRGHFPVAEQVAEVHSTQVQLLPSPCCRTSCSQKCGDKTRRLVGFATQQFPYTSEVWRSSLVRWRGGTGLAHLPGMTEDSSLEPSAAQSSCGKIDNVQSASTFTPWLDTPGTHVFLDMALRVSSSWRLSC